jgi:hypothetical protein
MVEGRNRRIITFGSGGPGKGLEPYARRRRQIYRRISGRCDTSDYVQRCHDMITTGVPCKPRSLKTSISPVTVIADNTPRKGRHSEDSQNIQKKKSRRKDNSDDETETKVPMIAANEIDASASSIDFQEFGADLLLFELQNDFPACGIHEPDDPDILAGFEWIQQPADLFT